MLNFTDRPHRKVLVILPHLLYLQITRMRIITMCNPATILCHRQDLHLGHY